MKSLLPLVSFDIRFSIDHEMAEGDWTVRYIEHLEKTNPAIAHFLSRYLEQLPEDMQSYVMVGALATYRLLESQAEADVMQREMG